MIIRQERVIFVGFKEIINWQSQESISSVKKLLFQTSTGLLFWPVEFFQRIFHTCYAYEKQSWGSKESLGTNKTIIRHVEMITRQERAIFVGFKEIISWQSQESISSVKKLLFQTSTGLLFWPVEFFQRIFHTCYAYEKQSWGSKESLGTNKTIIRHVEMITRQERAIFVGFKEMRQWKM